MAAKRKRVQAQAYEPWNNVWRRIDSPWVIYINGRKDWHKFANYQEVDAYLQAACKANTIPPAAQIRVSKILKTQSKGFWARLWGD